MNKFKVGDQVKVVFKNTPRFGKIGIIVKIKVWFYVKIEGKVHKFMNESSLEKVAIWSVS